MPTLVVLPSYSIKPKPVHVDVDSVESVKQGHNGPNHTIIRMKSGDDIHVKGKQSEVKDLLKTK